MKTFIIAACIFSVMLVSVIFSSWRSVSVSEELLSLAEELPESIDGTQGIFSDVIDRFNEKWMSERLFIHFVIGHTENQAIEDSLDELTERYKSGDQPGYMSARKRLISSIDRIINTESLSIDTVF